MKLRHIFRGLSSVFGSLFLIAICASVFACDREMIINSQLGIDTTIVKNKGSNTGETYFASEFGEINAENQLKLIQASRDQTYNEAAEGCVLLYNKNDALPLSNSERSVSFFGRSSVDLITHNGGTTTGLQNSISLRDALDNKNFSVNQTLWNAYEQDGNDRDNYTGDIGEVNFDTFYTNEIKNSYSSSFNDVAFIVLSRSCGEGEDLFHSDKDGVPSLSLHERERKMIEMVTSSHKFNKVVVLLNTGSPMELDWLYEYDIDACIWFGTLGETGMQSLIDILVGEVNPSGHLVDTYATNSLSAPSSVGTGYETPQFINKDVITSRCKDGNGGTTYYTIESEGIYIGYKYYETRYEDCILNEGNAKSKPGSSTDNDWNYADEMTFTFGHGLSYTTFKQTLDSVTYDSETDTYTATVTVKNIGDVKGKDVVQLYSQTPYGEYEKQNYVEKSSVNLIKFAKTKLLDKNESQTLTLTFDKYLLASYDYKNAKTYVMSEGDYYLSIGCDAHDALNNILAKKGKTGLFDARGNSVTGDSTKAFKWNETFDKEKYSKGENDYPVTNRFEDCDIQKFYPDKDIKEFYVTRQNWKDSYPTEPILLEATDEMITLIDNYFYTKSENATSASTIIKGNYQGITLLDMIGKDYDDPLWDDYLDQFTYDDLAKQFSDGSGTPALAKVLKPATKHGDGMDGNGNAKLPYKVNDKTYYANLYCAKVILTSTWNEDLYRRRGQLMGEECLYCKMHTIFNVGCDIHRNVLCGRNPEYMSEDAHMNYYASIPEVKGAMEKGVFPSVKHFAGNTQEYQRSGVSTMFNEQSWREADLRAFEGALRVAKTRGLMQTLNRVGLRYGPTVRELHTELLRGEWGFVGTCETDGCTGSNFKMHWADMIHAGTDVFCLDVTSVGGKALVKKIQSTDDGDLLLEVREAIKRYHYVCANSCAMNGISNDVVIETVEPWWKVLIYIALPVLGVLTIGFVSATVLFEYKEKKSIGGKYE